MKEQCEYVTWSLCPTPSLRAPSAQRPIQLDVSEALSQSLLYLLRALPGTAPSPPDLQAELGPSKGKSSAKDPPPWGWAGAPVATTHSSGNTTSSFLIFLCRARM